MLSGYLPHLFGFRFRVVVALAAVVLLLLISLVYWVSRVVRARTLLGVPNCPGCSSTDVQKTPDKALADGFFRLVGCIPYRCYGCGGYPFRFERESTVCE